MNKKSFDSASLKRFLPYLLKYRLENIAALLLGIAAGTTSVYMTYLIGEAVDQLVGKNKVKFDQLASVLALFVGVVVVMIISQLLIQLLGNRVAYLAAADLRKEAYQHSA